MVSRYLRQNRKNSPIMKRYFGLLLLPLFLAINPQLRGTTVIAPDFDQLVTRAELIFQGEVTDVRSQWIGEGAEHRIVSFVTFKVADALKGNPGASYTIRMLGGTVGGQTLEVSDAPKFKIGDRDILFVENNGSQFIPLVGIHRGRFRVERDEAGREIVMTGERQPLADVEQLGKGEATIATGRAAMSVNDFKAAIQTKLRQAQVSARSH
jgi:hypothetical protein